MADGWHAFTLKSKGQR